MVELTNSGQDPVVGTELPDAFSPEPTDEAAEALSRGLDVNSPEWIIEKERLFVTEETARGELAAARRAEGEAWNVGAFANEEAAVWSGMEHANNPDPRVRSLIEQGAREFPRSAFGGRMRCSP